jgi:hypothetical protein
MWLGIVAVVGLGLLALYVEHFAYMGYKGFLLRALLVALVTGGLIVTFKDKKPKAEQGNSKKLRQKVDRVIVGDIKMDENDLLDLLAELLVDTKQARERGTIDEETRVKNIERADKLFDLLGKNNK